MAIAGGNNLLNANDILQEVELHEGMRVADFGCGGSGHFVLPAAKIVESKGRVYAVDILRAVLESVQSRARLEGLSHIQTVWSDIERFGATPIPSQSLDQGYLINILFQSRNHSAILEEVFRLLKNGGTLLVIDWTSDRTPFGPPQESRIDKRSLEDVALSIGFVLKKRFDAGKYHFGLIFKKK